MMAADAIGFDHLFGICQAVEPGDEVEYEHAATDYKNPPTVVETHVDEWVNDYGGWREARLVLDTGHSERTISSVEGDIGPRDRTSGSLFKVRHLAPLEETVDAWCGRCGVGPMPETAVRTHNNAVHQGGPIIWDVEPDDPEELPGGGEPLGDLVRFTDHGADTGTERTCQNCGAHVTKQYAKVMDPDSEKGPVCCPNCPDLVRDGVQNEVREKRSGGGPSTVVDSS